MHRPGSGELTVAHDCGSFVVVLHLQSNGTWAEMKELTAVNSYAQQTKESLIENLDPTIWSGVFYHIEHLRKRGPLESMEEEL